MPTFNEWNFPRFVEHLTDISKNMEAEVFRRARVANIYFKLAAQGVVSGPRTGRWYLRPNGELYQASAPKEPPTEKSGEMADSFETEIEFSAGVVQTWEGGRDARVEIRLKNDRQAAGGGPLINYLEFGTKFMEPRPSRARIIRAAWPLVQAEFNRNFFPGIAR